MFRKIPRLIHTRLRQRRFQRLLRDKGRRLHVGCGDDYLEGYINIDADPASRADIVMDVFQLWQFPAQCVERIESYHFLEHLFYHDAMWVLRQWHRLLVPGGVVVIELPDFAVCARELGKYFTDHNFDLAMVGIYGNPPQVKSDGAFQAHRWGWTFEALGAALERCGFHDVTRHPVRQTYRSSTAFNRDMQVRACKPGGADAQDQPAQAGA